MDHDDDVSIFIQSGLIAGLLISTIAPVFLVANDFKLVKPLCYLKRSVCAGIIDKDQQINIVLADYLLIGFK